MVKKSKKSDNPFLSLTWLNLESWAGKKVLARGKSYRSSKQVGDFGITERGVLAGWVQGTKPYAASAGFRGGRLYSACTCPYGANCKHAVALILEYIERVKKGREIPAIGKDDPKLKKIQAGYKEDLDESDYDMAEDNDGVDDDDDDDDWVPAAVSPPAAKRRRNTRGATGIRTLLKGKSRAELTAMLREIAEKDPSVTEHLRFRDEIASGSSPALIKSVMMEIDKVSSEPGWDDWNRGGGYTPDYSGVQAGLRKLLKAGKADEVVKLGGYLLAKGNAQLEQSTDEYETGDALSETMDIAFEALNKCALPEADKMEKVIEWEQKDEFGMCRAERFWKKKFSRKGWGELADRLLSHLPAVKTSAGGNGKGADWERDRLTDRIITALDKAGRRGEVIPLCIREVKATSSFDRLVIRLKGEGRFDEAEIWIRKGLAAFKKQGGGHSRGLIGHLREIRIKKRDWTFVTALNAVEFFRQPSLETYRSLKKAAIKARLCDPVQAAAKCYLKTGRVPRLRSEAWPLPDPGLGWPQDCRTVSPSFSDTLIEIAILERDPVTALNLFDQIAVKAVRGRVGSALAARHSSIAAKVAAAVKTRFPARAAEIWHGLAMQLIAQTDPRSYAQAFQLLKRVRDTLRRQGTPAKWDSMLSEIRKEHKRKTRLMSILDAMDGRPIFQKD